jgi:repressor LexA
MAKDFLGPLANFYQEEQRMPSFSELAGLWGYKSKNAVSKKIKELKAQDLVKQDASGHLLPADWQLGCRLLGQVEAGFPSPAQEERLGRINLDSYLIKNKQATYLLKVSGYSMKDLGIMPGDMVLAERGAQARDGDIVIAEVDGEWTIKTLRKSSGRFWLQPANDRFKPIYPEGELNIAAVVRGVVRRY